MFNIKFIFVLCTLILILLISKSSQFYQLNEISTDVNNKSAMLFTTQEETPNKNDIEAQKKLEKEIFKKLKDRFDIAELQKNEAQGVEKIASYLQVKKLEMKDEPTEELAKRMFQKLKQYNDAQKTDYFAILLLVVFSYFVPEAFLYLRSYLVKYYIYNEYLQLEVTAIMVGKLDPIKVEEILNVLSENSKYFKRYIDEIRYNYFDVKEGHSKAFDSVINRISHKELKYLMKALQQAAESDLKLTIENLENQRKSNKEFRNIREQNKLKQKELIGILIILVVLAAVCSYAFAPFQDVMNSFNI